MPRTFAPCLLALLVCLTGWGCGVGPGVSVPLRSPLSPRGPDKSSGTLNVLTYNVAGLPAWFSPSNPDVNSRRVSPHLNRYDIVLAQEDFSYHDDLVHAANHPFQLAARDFGSGFVGDGLTTLSTYPVLAEQRQTWRACNGYLLSLNDCLGEKGFSLARIDLYGGRSIHVYNLHADAGSDEDDVQARAEGFDQLAEFIDVHSKGVALIVGGDTNLDPRDARDLAILHEFLKRTRLRDACPETGCVDLQIDRILFRSSSTVRLRVEERRQDRAFVDNLGHALSDHPAIAVRFGWVTTPGPWHDAPAQARKRANLARLIANHAAP